MPWECNKCGACCRFQDIKCSYLQEDNLCSIYDKRLLGFACLTVKEMKRFNILPENCAYKN